VKTEPIAIEIEHLQRRVAELAATNAQLMRQLADARRAEPRSLSRESFLGSMVESMPVPIGIMTPAGECEAVNRPVLDYTGKTLEELKHWTTGDVVHPDDRPMTVTAWSRALKSGQPYEIETRLRRADGTYRWHHVQTFPIRDTEGRIVRWCVLQTDIDDRKRAEEEVRNRDVLLESILESVAAPMSLWGTDGEPEATNQLLGSYFGKALTTLDEWQAVLHPAERNAALERWKRALVTGEAYNEEVLLRHVDGTYRWNDVRNFPMRGADGGVVRWVVVQLDIHDRKQAEEALAASERRLNLIINTIPAMAWSADIDGNVDFFNQHFLDYVGLPLERMRGSGWRDTVHPDDVDRLVAAWRAVMGERRTGGGEAEARLRRFDGTYRWFLMRVSPLTDGNAEVVRWYGVNTDIEDRKRAEDALRDTQSELAHLTRAMTMGQLTASIAHELNQPLAGIIANASTCLRMLGADPPNVTGAKETARRTIRDGNRASEVIARLRALFSKKHPAMEVVDLNAATQEIIALTLAELQRNGVTLRVDLDEELPLVSGDRVQLQQVVLNLILNAIEAMQGVADRRRELVISTGRDGSDHVRLAVKDVGVGVDAGAIEKLFHPFYTTKSSGMGIGLSVCRSIITTHQGRLWAEPNDGPGATFAFSIPCEAKFDADVDGLAPTASAPSMWEHP